MARIREYIKDDIVEPTDIVIGTEQSTGKTKNYSIDSIRNFFVTETNVGGIIFKKGNHLVSGEFTANSNYFSGVTEFKFNKTNTQGDSVIPIFNTLKTNLVNNRFTINVEDSTNQNRFILAKILNIIDNDTFFTITLDIVKNVGNGELVTGNNFSIEVGLYTEAIDGTKITTVTSNKVGNVTTVTVNGDFDNAPLIFEILDGDATSGVDWSNLLNIPISFPPSAHTHTISDVTSLQSSLDSKVDENAPIIGATKTKITYDSKGLVTSGADATTADITDSLNKRYVTDADLVDIGNLSGINTGDQDLSGKENTANKQNSLTVDGTGIKFPTVDAVNAGIAGVNTDKVPYTGATGNVNIGGYSFTGGNIFGAYGYFNPMAQFPTGGYISVNGNGTNYFKGWRNSRWESDMLIKYMADYSANYDNRTLIDKGYLDTRLGGTGTGFELISNKVTSLSGASTDVQYPSAKLTYDQLALKENVANKQNSLAFDGTGNKYPTVDAITAPNIPAARLGNSTFTSVQHIQDLFHSAGWTSGGVITNAGGGLITVSAGTGLIRAINSDVATIYFTDFPASTPANVVLVDGSQNYIYVEYNAGSPRIIATTVERADYNTSFLIGAVYRVGTTLHINPTVKTAISDHAQKMIAFNKEVMPYARANGSMISEVATRGFAITAGTFWNGLVRFTTNAFSTATSSFFYFYRNGVGGWTKVPTQTQINNTQYDNGTGTLATLSNNKYGIHWVFIDTDGDTYVVYGQGDYTLIEAQNEMIPASLPVEITSHGFVVGKIIIQKSATTFAQIESAFAMGFSSAMASEHNSLAGLQGGAAGDYQHLTATQATIATQEATNALSGYVSAGTQTFGGVKTFTLSPIVPTPTTDTQVANKIYVDGKVADTITDGVTTIAPSQNAVFDALVLKEPANANIQAHISSTSNPHGVTKAQVGLSNVDNVQQIPLTQKGAINGVAELDAQGFVKNTQLPSYVDDVIEGTLATFPATGETGKIYVDTVTNKTYRWSGTVYTVISETIALGETDSTAYRGDRGKIAYDHSQLTHDKTFVGLGNVDNTSDINKPVSTAQQTALNLKVDKNDNIVAGTKTKITYDVKGLVTNGEDATTTDIADSLNKRYVTDAEKTAITHSNRSALDAVSGSNTGDQTSIVGITGTKAQFDTAVTDGNFMYIGDAPTAHTHAIADTTGLQTALDGKVDDSQVLTNVPAGAVFTDTVYTHPTTDGNLHVPATGTTNNGNVLKAGATAGSLVWGTDNDTIYTHPTTAGNKHIPAGGAAGQVLKYSADGTAVWGTDNDTIYTHPLNHPPSIITQDASNRFVTDTEKTTWNAKIDGTGTINYIPKFIGTGTLGNSAIFESGGNVGIGTTSPLSKLHVAGLQTIVNGIGDVLNFKFSDAYGNTSLALGWDSGSDAGNNLSFKINNAAGSAIERMRILGNGNVLIGTTTDNSAKLQVNGSATFAGSVTATDFIGSSDITLKENIQALQPKKINSNYKTFNFIGSEQQRVGVIAQELEIEHPEFVRTDDKGIKSVSYTDLHSCEIAYLKDKIEKLEELVNKLIG